MKRQSGLSKAFCAVFLLLTICFILAPIFSTVLFSFDQGRFSTLPLRGFTLDWYREVLGTGM